MNKFEWEIAQPVSSVSAWCRQHFVQREVAIMSTRLKNFLCQRFSEPHEDIRLAIDFLGYFGQGEEVPQGTLVQRASEAIDTPFYRLIQALELSETELQLLVLSGLAQEHEGFADIFRILHPCKQPYLTVALANQLLGDEQARGNTFFHLLSSTVLLRHGLIRLHGEGPVNSQSLVMAAEYWNLLTGAGVDEAFCSPEVSYTVGLEPWFKSRSVQHAVETIKHQLTCTVMVFDHNPDIALFRTLALLSQLQRKVLVLNSTSGGEGLHNDQAIPVQHFYWSCILSNALPLIVISQGQQSIDLSLFKEMRQALILCGVSGSFPDLPGRIKVNLPIEKLSSKQTQRIWQDLLPELSSSAALLASRYPVEPYYAQQMVDGIRSLCKKAKKDVSLATVDEFFRNSHGANLPESVSLVQPKLGWEQLVLPQGQQQQLKEAINRLMAQQKVVDEWQFLVDRRGARGVRMLFSGPPGTGKTLSAEVLAKALNTDLLIVDISRLVSKWVGETEKNLAEVFNQAEQMRAVLFFDEADAIFGKRTEVSDAHDRYANLETAYLLSRLETYDGLAILATNYRNNIDAAFIRRLDFIIEFREPSSAERERLWRCHVPQQAPLAGT